MDNPGSHYKIIGETIIEIGYFHFMFKLLAKLGKHYNCMWNDVSGGLQRRFVCPHHTNVDWCPS